MELENNNSNQKKIVYLIENFPSPTEHFVLNEMLELEHRGIELEVLVLKKQNKYMCMPELNDLRASVIYLPKLYRYFSFFFLFKNPLLFPKLIQLGSISSGKNSLKSFRDYCIGLYFFSKLKRTSITHFHAHFAFLAVDIASVLSKLFGLNYSLTMHANDIYTNTDKIKKVIRESSFVITCTEYNREYLNKVTCNKYQDKIHKVYHGIDTSKWTFRERKDVNTSEIKIISVARLVEKKGLFYLLESIKILVDKGKNINCTIIGEGVLKDKMIDFIRTNRLEAFIKIIGFQKQDMVRQMFIKSDVFVLPSIIAQNGDRDGLPNVIVEAMALGLPVISTATSAIPEVIEDRITGLLVKEKDSLAIARAIDELIANQELYNLIRKNAENKIQSKMHIEHATNKIANLFRSQATCQIEHSVN
ncbi:glycosyltransferase family 4 protein [Aquimarina pacifica]|uniref:glycosyltransferase family 4 protein n=1 Tax=Aquimarina pacifica TaxID=1296415 RepID=UPI00046F10A6|nr:glycosyltransferase family 4 protein [Aquimarina pacifica]